jgi:glycosyltransferase
MRLLFTAMPCGSHLIHMVPLAQAAQAAGHEVLVATSGPALETSRVSGLTGYDVATGPDPAATYQEHLERLTASKEGLPLSDEEQLDYYGQVFGEIGVRMMDGLLEVGRAFRPDAVVYTPIHAAGLLAARELGARAVLHPMAIPRPTLAEGRDYIVKARPELADHADRDADVRIELTPPSVRPFTHRFGPEGPPVVLPMRYVPQTVGSQLPAWGLRAPDRPRVLVTFGSMAEMGADGNLYRTVLDATDAEVELVLTTAGADLGELPARVRAAKWIPLRLVMRTCAAIVHHGGIGTVFSSFAAGLPQVSVPRPGMDCVENAAIVSARGAGLTVSMPEARPDTVGPALRTVLDDPSFAVVGAEVSAEVAAMPSPAAVVRRLEEGV